MIKLTLPFSLFLIVIMACGQHNNDKDVEKLKERFAGFVNAVETMNIDSIQAYTYPKLFTIISKEESRLEMEKSHQLVRGKATIGSARIDSISTVFTIGNGRYARADYSIEVKMPVDSTEISENITLPDSLGNSHFIGTNYPAPKSTLMATLIRSGTGMAVTSYEEKNGMTIMRLRVVTIAAKDEFAKEWSFFPVLNDQEAINKLFPKKLLETLASKDK
jgi:hypothetical protein